MTNQEHSLPGRWRVTHDHPLVVNVFPTYWLTTTRGILPSVFFSCRPSLPKLLLPCSCLATPTILIYRDERNGENSALPRRAQPPVSVSEWVLRFCASARTIACVPYPAEVIPFLFWMSLLAAKCILNAAVGRAWHAD